MDKIFKINNYKAQIMKLQSSFIVILDALDNQTGTLSLVNIKDSLEILIENFQNIYNDVELFIFFEQINAQYLKDIFENTNSLLKILYISLANNSNDYIQIKDVYNIVNLISKNLSNIVENLKYKRLQSKLV